MRRRRLQRAYMPGTAITRLSAAAAACAPAANALHATCECANNRIHNTRPRVKSATKTQRNSQPKSKNDRLPPGASVRVLLV